MMHHARASGLLALLALSFLPVACGDGGSEPQPTATASATPVPATASPTATAGQPSVTPRPRATNRPAATCRDPYPQGAPTDSMPGAAIRLRPTGAPPPAPLYQPLPLAVDPGLERIVRQALGPALGRFGVVVKNLADGRGVAINADRVFYAASLFKTWVMYEAFHQRWAGLLDFAERFVVTDYYQQFGLNPGELRSCDSVAVAEALSRMMSISDNVAANLLLDRVGSGNVNQALADLGLRQTRITPETLPTTAGDMALLLEAIARRQAVDAAASDEMVALLASEGINDRLPALLPPGTRVAHKTGNWENATHDAGIVFSPRAAYVIVVLSDFGFGEDGATPIARLSLAVHEHYNRD